MPDRKGEHDWEAIVRAINPNTLPADYAGKIAAIWMYHQWKLHGLENHLTPERRERMERETFSLLSDDEKRVLDEAHHYLVRHNY